MEREEWKLSKVELLALEERNKQGFKNTIGAFIRGYEKASEELFTKDDLIAFYEFIKKECDIVNTSGYAETHTKWFIEKLKNYEIKR
jgi:hypothetical protein